MIGSFLCLYQKYFSDAFFAICCHAGNPIAVLSLSKNIQKKLIKIQLSIRKQKIL